MLCFLWIFKTIAPSPCPVKNKATISPGTKMEKGQKLAMLKSQARRKQEKTVRKLDLWMFFLGQLHVLGGNKGKRKVATLFSKQDKPTSYRNVFFSICQLYFKAMVVYPIFPREQDPPLTLWTIVIDAGSPPSHGQTPPSPHSWLEQKHWWQQRSVLLTSTDCWKWIENLKKFFFFKGFELICWAISKPMVTSSP